MARAGHEPDAQSFEVVVGIVHGVDLQLAAVARARVHVPDGERAGEPAQHPSFSRCAGHAQRLVGFGGGSVTMPVFAICFSI